jgi:hypothetical protein
MKGSGADKPWTSVPGSDLLHHVAAISLALKKWNDTEALRLLRLHWDELVGALQANESAEERGLPAVITVPVAPSPTSVVARHPQVYEDMTDDPGQDRVSTLYPSSPGTGGEAPYRDSAMTSSFQLVVKEAKYRS